MRTRGVVRLKHGPWRRRCKRVRRARGPRGRAGGGGPRGLAGGRGGTAARMARFRLAALAVAAPLRAAGSAGSASWEGPGLLPLPRTRASRLSRACRGGPTKGRCRRAGRVDCSCTGEGSRAHIQLPVLAGQRRSLLECTRDLCPDVPTACEGIPPSSLSFLSIFATAFGATPRAASHSSRSLALRVAAFRKRHLARVARVTRAAGWLAEF